MRISIFGLGYVGAVSAACLAQDGHQVIGVDSSQDKVDFVNQGIAPIVEKDIAEMTLENVRLSRLRATTDVQEAIQNTDVSLVCVGTPSQTNGNLDLSFVRKVCEEIGTALRDKDAYHVVALRSTMLPGSARSVVLPTLAVASGKMPGKDFGVCVNPEFLREGTAVYDYRHPPKTVIGETDMRAGDVLVKLYAGIEAPLVRTSVETSEMVKYADNTWHAIKVVFANEIGNICKLTGIDGQEVMDIFCRDTKLNLSAYYLKPGFAFGGSCLPKDVRALAYKARSLDLDAPMLNAILPSNERQIRKAIDMIVRKGQRRVGILGFAFKAGTDDLRESPMVEVIEHLIGKGYDLRIYDRNVSLAALTGTNREFILHRIPHICRLMVSTLQEIMDHGETLVVGNSAEEFRDVGNCLRQGQNLVDLVRIGDKHAGENYDGICW
ncbi:nucleotide sugar dehydrogenase [Azohydromonas lata]|uniref:nucleotide sugar dehydrogenase n=1 Tax=Azohydromonas lata TaxID=45677 RepID=UPI0009FC1C1F|nr:UDP-glucose/GDP-mannose dehydrogenase family protein [Azohydromonas lata]